MGDEQIERSPGGSWILRHHARDGELPWETGGFHDDLGDELQRAFSEPTVVHEIFPEGEHIDVWIVPPNRLRPYQTLVTAGMSDAPMTVPDGYSGHGRLELVLSLPPGWALTDETMRSERAFWPVRLLRTLARFPRRYDTFLDERHTVPNGDDAEPYALNTKMVCALIGPSPFSAGEIPALKAADGTSVDFVSVIPIYRDEMEFKLQHGADALFARLRRAGVTELLDIKRASVCRRKRFGLF